MLCYKNNIIMKQILLLFLVAPLFVFAQWTKIGSDIDGEAAGDESGISVSLSDDGTIVAIGALKNANNIGHVRVYENIAGVWNKIGSDIDGLPGGSFFGEVSISGDGSIVAIGAFGTNNFAGHVSVYKNIADVWTKIGSDIVGESAQDRSGEAVSLNSDGSIVAIGAIFNFGSTGEDSGHVRVYENQSGVWMQLGADIDGEAFQDQFGHSVSLSDDGTILAASSVVNFNGGNYNGHVRIFKYNTGSWTQVDSDIDANGAGQYFGNSLSLSSNGSIVAIGANRNGAHGTSSGRVQVFENVLGVWTKIGSDIDGVQAFDNMGFSVSLSSSGSILAVSVPLDDDNGTNSGHVQVYENIAGVWTLIGAYIEGEAAEDWSGYSVSLSSDGMTVAIGAAFNDDNGIDSGHVRVYNMSALSITTNNFGPQFRAQPNPSFGSTFIELGDFYQEAQVSVFDLLGKEVMNKTYNNTNKIELNTQQFTTGVYIVKVESNTKKASLKLIVK